ncbi:MAG: GAF and ANTAR domain-containing protein [Mycobacterium sp.]
MNPRDVARDEGAVAAGDLAPVMTRLDGVATALRSLQGTLITDESLDAVLRQVAQCAVGAVPPADAVSITVLGEDAVRTAASTDEPLLALDAKQYASSSGPCWEAAHSRRPVRFASDAPELRWPEFVTAARADGVCAILSIPMIVTALSPADGSELVGSLNAYSRQADFDVVDEKLLSLYTDTAFRAVANARHCQTLRAKVGDLERALLSRSDIDQAKGALRVLRGGSAEEAFAELVRLSQRDNVKLRVVARHVMDQLSGGLSP